LAFGIRHSALIDRGSGTPVVVIPGIQGRWEWMKPAVDALAKRCRVITFSLGGGRSVDAYIRQIDGALDRAGLERAALCGVSMGGVVALRYAAMRPERTSALVLVSTPGPRWKPNRRQAFFAKHWLISSPLFVVNAVRGLLPEVASARKGWWPAVTFMSRHGARTLRFPASAWRMKQRFDAWLGDPREPLYERIAAPTLIVTGDAALDRVVPVEDTLEYAREIQGARVRVLEETGHIGLVTRPERFAEIVASFVNSGCTSQLDAPGQAVRDQDTRR